MAENEIDQDFNDDNHAPFSDLNENLQHYCQCDQENEDNHSYVSSGCTFTDFLFQEETCKNQSFEVACMETLGSEPIHDSNTPQYQEDNEYEVVYLDSSEN